VVVGLVVDVEMAEEVVVAEGDVEHQALDHLAKRRSLMMMSKK
jgi:hypothetical protein